MQVKYQMSCTQPRLSDALCKRQIQCTVYYFPPNYLMSNECVNTIKNLHVHVTRQYFMDIKEPAYNI